MDDLNKIRQKVNKYEEVLKNTEDYRKAWHDGLSDLIKDTLEKITAETGLPAEVEIQDNVENLEIIIYNLGRTTSGISEKVGDIVRRPMIKSNGALIYQQLFNGKILVMVALPYIDGYGEPRPPKTIEILRPHELIEAFIHRHVETFMDDITEWEDYDDDVPQQRVGFNPIGFTKPENMDMEIEDFPNMEK